jgi:putative ABC transport system permease protein
VAYAVSQRSKEFGIRLALGSPRHKILTLVLCQGAWLSIAGIGLGLALAWPATRLLARTLKESMLLTLVQTGPELFPALCAGIALTMMLACIFPARRATKADPMQALRCE